MWNRVEGTAADHASLVRGQSQRKGCTALGTGESILTFLACEGKEGVFPCLPPAPWGKSGGIISRDGAGMGRRVEGWWRREGTSAEKDVSKTSEHHTLEKSQKRFYLSSYVLLSCA